MAALAPLLLASSLMGVRCQLIVTIFALSLFSCATSEQRRHYDLARDHIVRAHESALFAPSSSWITREGFSSGGYELDIQSLGNAPEACTLALGKPISLEAVAMCNEWLSQAFIAAIQRKYFAATEDLISKECHEHFVACADPMAFEYIVRSVHNAEIQSSEESKLRALEKWAKGLTTDDELLATIGISAWRDLEDQSPDGLQGRSLAKVSP